MSSIINLRLCSLALKPFPRKRAHYFSGHSNSIKKIDFFYQKVRLFAEREYYVHDILYQNYQKRVFLIFTCLQMRQ